MSNTIFATPADDLQSVLDTAPCGSLIHLSSGIYRQKIIIHTPALTLEGEGADNTVLIYDDYALKKDERGVEYVTFRTYTAAVTADGVTMRNLAVVNDALHPESKGQEVALSVVGDRFLMENCRLTSTQDTLFAGPLPPDLIERYDGFLIDDLRRGGHMREEFRHTLIEGTVDFIFGCADALFTDCEIHSLVDARDIGYTAAPAHSLDQEEGFYFLNCRFTKEEGVPPHSVYLARPWRDYGLCIFENCSYDDHIAPAGFDPWNDTRRDLTARFFERPAVNGRVSWINRSE